MIDLEHWIGRLSVRTLTHGNSSRKEHHYSLKYGNLLRGLRPRKVRRKVIDDATGGAWVILDSTFLSTVHSSSRTCAQSRNPPFFSFPLSSFLNTAFVVNVILILIANFVCYSNCSKSSSSVYSNHFAVHIPAGEDRANEIASQHGFINTGQIGSLQNYFLFEHGRIRKRSIDHSHEHHKILSAETDVLWFEQQVEKRRVKRDFQYYDGGSGSSPFFSSPSTHSYVSPYSNGGFPDPLWKEQWYLTGGSKDGFDMNVQVAWKRGYTGKGITVSILDDGIQTNHPDLLLNYDPRASTDINDNDNDPYPQDNGDNKHGTRCAGEVAATAGNNICGVGVAYNASIGGVRMLDGTVNDAVEAKALGLNPDHIDIFSASWGPEDDGKTVDGPGPLARRAFIYGVTNGRRGLGSIFIWASGNGGRHVDSCNCDGYTNSIFTLSISSATQGGYKPWYLEECSSTLATTYSSGTPTLDKSVATVDMDGRLRPDHICTVEHTGTSASAPLAAGIAALALEANSNLSWRDLQHLVVLTSRPDPLEKEEGWYVNGVQRKFSHKFGYGLMDAGKMVDFAVDWAGVPPQHICKSREIREDREIPGSHLGKVKVFMDVDGCAGTNSEIRYLEHVQCKISLRFFPRGNLRILLTSPMGTTSVLLFERPRDVSSSNFDDWPFLSVHFWGEQAHGRWTLEIINSGSRRINQPGLLKKWQLILYGTDANPIRLKSRSLQAPSQYQSQSLAAGQGQQTHSLYRAVHHSNEEVTQVPPRFVPQEYLFGSASEVQEQSVSVKQHMVRSQCQNEFWVRDLSICVNGCPDGYFADHNTKECLSCKQRCKSCRNATSCTACEHNLALFGTECVARCPIKFYQTDSNCEPCRMKNCSLCAGPTGTECVQCEINFFLEDNTCVPSCSPGRRPNVNAECVNCQTGCASCSITGECFHCHDGFTLSGNICAQKTTQCPPGMFLDEQSRHCVRCTDGNCLNCDITGQCVHCRDGMLAKRGACVSSCGDGFYAEPTGKECFRCPGLCKTCQSDEICTECRFDGVHQNGTCLPHCSDGYFNDVGSCVSCSSACLTCIGPQDNECVTCGPKRRLTKSGTCGSLDGNEMSYSPQLAVHYSNGTCSDGFFYDFNTRDCRDCHPSCSRCSGSLAFQCRSCKYPLRLDRGSSRCIPCCHFEKSEDCCHCDENEKRHAGHSSSPSPEKYNGECHFVSRRVSESEESELSSGTLSDRVVLMSFWFTVFMLVLAGVIIFQRKKSRNKREDTLPSSSNYFNSSIPSLGFDGALGSCGSSKARRHNNRSSFHIRYTPVNINEDLMDERRDLLTAVEEDDFEANGQECGQFYEDHKSNRKEVADSEELEEENEAQKDSSEQVAGVLLVLKT